MSVLSEETVDSLVLSLARSRSPESFTEEEATKLVEWAEETVTAYTLFIFTIKHKINVDVREDGEIVFQRREDE